MAVASGIATSSRVVRVALTLHNDNTMKIAVSTGSRKPNLLSDFMLCDFLFIIRTKEISAILISTVSIILMQPDNEKT